MNDDDDDDDDDDVMMMMMMIRGGRGQGGLTEVSPPGLKIILQMQAGPGAGPSPSMSRCKSTSVRRSSGGHPEIIW
eukprot:12415964-Karenia_brevis.AAC.1